MYKTGGDAIKPMYQKLISIWKEGGIELKYWGKGIFLISIRYDT